MDRAITRDNDVARYGTQSSQPSQPTMRSLVAMESFKLRKRPMTKVIFGLTMAGSTLAMTAGYLATRSSNTTSTVEKQDQLQGFLLPDIIPNALNQQTDVGGVMLAVLAASLIGSEYGWGTVRVLVGSGVSRGRLIVAKLLALLEWVVLFIAAGMGTALFASLGITVSGGHDLTFSWLDADTTGDIGLMLMRTVLTIFVPAVIAFTVALLSRSQAAGIAVGIGMVIIEGIATVILSGFGERGESLRQVLLMNNIDALQALNDFSIDSIPSHLPGAWQAAAMLTAYAVIMIVASVTVFRSRDITSST